MDREVQSLNNDVFIAFGVFQLTFFLLDIYILSKTGRDVARKGEYTWFCVLICTHMGYLLLNTLWTMAEYKLLHIPRGVLTAVCTVSLWTVTNCATSFFLFVVEKLELRRLQSGAGRWLRQLPALISTFLIASSPWTGLVFSLDEQLNLVHGSLYLPTVTVSSLYLLTVAAVATANMLRARTVFLRRANGALLVSVLIILLYIAADGTMTKASILPAAIFAVITVIFLSLQQANINSDSLTGMNNRRKAEDYLSSIIDDVSEKAPLYLYMGDLNGFKKINDSFGHLVGDEALILCSRALKSTIARYDGFAARYGGDEFLFAWNPGKGQERDPEKLIRDINLFLEELSEGKPYRLVMTVGYACCTNPTESLNAYVRQADEMLYERKAAANAGR